MKKVLCNELYEVKVPVTHKEIGDVPVDLGIFVELEDAECAGLLARKVLSMKDVFDFVEVGNYEVSKEYIPKAEMESQKVVSRLHNDLEHFALNDTFMNHYMNQYGFIALSELIIDCIEEIESRDKNLSNPAQKGE